MQFLQTKATMTALLPMIQPPSSTVQNCQRHKGRFRELLSLQVERRNTAGTPIKFLADQTLFVSREATCGCPVKGVRARKHCCCFRCCRCSGVRQPSPRVIGAATVNDRVPDTSLHASLDLTLRALRKTAVSAVLAPQGTLSVAQRDIAIIAALLAPPFNTCYHHTRGRTAWSLWRLMQVYIRSSIM